MADALFNKGKEGLLNGSVDLDTDVIKCRLVKNTYSFSAAQASMTGVIAITGSTDQTLGTISVTDGVFDAADIAFSAVPSGETANALVIYKFDTDDAGSTPIAYIDSATNLPVATNGGDINVAWSSGANKIFSL